MVIIISGIIFLDLDGTILDTSERHYRVYIDILNSKGLVGLPKEKFWHMKRIGIKTRDILPTYLSEKTKTNFEEEWLQKIEKKIYLHHDKVFPETEAILFDLKKEFDLVLVTLRNNFENLYWELSKLNLEGYFKSIISGKGPKKNMVKNYLIKNYPVEKCLIIGDTEEDISAGLELNIPTISVTYGIRSAKFLKQFNPNYCINNLKDILDIIEN